MEDAAANGYCTVVWCCGNFIRVGCLFRVRWQLKNGTESFLHFCDTLQWFWRGLIHKGGTLWFTTGCWRRVHAEYLPIHQREPPAGNNWLHCECDTWRNCQTALLFEWGSPLQIHSGVSSRARMCGVNPTGWGKRLPTSVSMNKWKRKQALYKLMKWRP